MKRIIPLLSVFSLFIISCGSSKDDAPSGVFPIVSFLKSQVAQVDTTLNSIREYITVDSSATDTVYVHREQFRALAKDFLDLPDLSKPEYKGRYSEATQFDETLDRALFTYIAVKPEKELIQRQDVLIKPSQGNDQITSIIITTVNNSKDSAIQKRMLWQVDRSFQVVTTRQLVGQSPTTTTVKVVWNEE